MPYDPYGGKGYTPGKTPRPVAPPPPSPPPAAPPAPPARGTVGFGGFQVSPEVIERMKREAAARQEQMRVKLAEMKARSAERVRVAKEEKGVGQRPFRQLREEVAKQAVAASEAKPIPTLTPEAETTLATTQEAQRKFRAVPLPAFQKAAETVERVAPTFKIPETGEVGPREWQQLSTMERGWAGQPKPAGLTLGLLSLGPEGMQGEARQVEDAWRTLTEKPEYKSMEVKFGILPDDATDEMFGEIAWRLKPEEKAALVEMGTLLEKSRKLGERIDPWIAELGNQVFASNPDELDTIRKERGWDVEDKVRTEQWIGKKYSEIYSTRSATTPVESARPEEGTLVGEADPDYAAFQQLMDVRYPQTPMIPNMEMLSRTLGAARFPGTGLPLIGPVLKALGKGIKAGGTYALAVMALMDELPADLLGMMVSAIKYLAPGSKPGDVKEVLTRYEQFQQDVLGPAPVKPVFDPTKITGIPTEYKVGLEHIDVPMGRWGLPPEKFQYGFSYTENPWVHMVVSEIFSLQWLVPGITQAGALRKAGTISKLTNLSPEVGTLLKAGDIRGAWNAFQTSGLASRLVSDAGEAYQAGRISEWVEPTAKIYAEADDARQFDKLLKASIAQTNLPDVYTDVVAQWNRINQIEDVTKRTEQWGKYLTRMMAGGEAIPVKPGPLARFGTMHPQAYEAVKGAVEKGPLRPVFAATHVSPLRQFDLNTPEASEFMYGYLVNFGVRPSVAEEWVSKLLRADPLDKGMVVRNMEKYLEGDYMLGLNRRQTLRGIQANLGKNVPVLSPSDARVLSKQLDNIIPEEDALYDDVLGRVYKMLDDQGLAPEDVSRTLWDARKGSEMVESTFKNYVGMLEDGGAISKQEGKAFRSRLSGLAKTKKEFIENARGRVGKLEPLRMGKRGKGGGYYQYKQTGYGMVKVGENDIYIEHPLTTQQLSTIYRFKHDAVNEIYRYNHDEMSKLLWAGDKTRKAYDEVNAAIDKLSFTWKRWLVYTRPQFVAKSYLSGEFKSLLLGTIDPSDVRAYNKVMDKGIGVVDDIPVKISPETMNLVDVQHQRVLSEPHLYRREYTGSWLVADSRDDPAQAITNFMNQYLADPGVKVGLINWREGGGDSAFLDWLANDPGGQKMVRTWKPVMMGLGDDTDVAHDYMYALKELFAQTEESAPGTYKAMLYYMGIMDDEKQLPTYFQKALAKKVGTQYEGSISKNEIIKYLKGQGGKEYFSVPMTRHPYWKGGKAAKGKVMKWVEKDARKMYGDVFFAGFKTPRKQMFKSVTTDIAKQLMGKGIDPDTAFRTAATQAAKTTNDILLDFSRKLAVERKYDWMAPFFTATRLSSGAWAKLIAGKPGLASAVIKYYMKAANLNAGLPSYLRYSIPLKVGDYSYNVEIPTMLLMPWAYTLPEPGGEPAWMDVMRGTTGPIPRMAVAEIRAQAPRKRLKELREELARGVSDERAKDIAYEIQSLEWQQGGFEKELSGMFMGYPTAISRGGLKGTIKTKMDETPEAARVSGWTRPIYESLSESEREYIAYLMGQYGAYSGEKDTDKQFKWAYDQLPGLGIGGPAGPLLGAATAAVGKWARPLPVVKKPEAIQEGYKLKAAAIEGGEPYWTTTPFKPGTTEKYSPYEWSEEQQRRQYQQGLRAAQSAQAVPWNIAMTREPERYPEIAEAKGELPDWGAYTEEDTRRNREEMNKWMQMKAGPAGPYLPTIMTPEFAGKLGYTKEGMPTEALEMRRDYEDAKTAGSNQTWADYLAARAEAEAPYDPTRQQQILSYVDFYPYNYTSAQPTASSNYYGPYNEQVTQPYWDIINEITRLRDLKKGMGATEMSKAEIDAEIARLDEQKKALIAKGMVPPNLTMEVDMNKLLAPLKAAWNITGYEGAKEEFPKFNVTTEQLRAKAGMPPLAETTMPSPPEAMMMQKGLTGERKDKYVKALVALTSNPNTWGKPTIPVDMETAMYISGMNVAEIKKNRGDKGLGAPYWDPDTGQVYISSFPIDWLDQPTQDLIRASVDDATWATIMGNAAGQGGGGGGGGGGWKNYGYRKYGAGGRGFQRKVSPGPVDEFGGSKMDAFFMLPKSQRTAYLDANPDLKAYFRRQKEGEATADYQERMKLMDLGDRYYHIPERAARQGFLQEHPELVAYFEMLRQKKDKYFMAAMANAFTDNPELWEMYLNKQLELTDALIAQMGKRTYIPTPKEEKRTGRRV